MKAIQTVIILTSLTVLFTSGAVVPSAAQGSEGGGMSRAGTLPVLIGGGPPGISRGATGVHSIPFGDRNGIRNKVNIEAWPSDAVNVIDVAGKREHYSGGFWTDPAFVSRVHELDGTTRKSSVDGMTEFVILLMLEKPYGSNVQRILDIVNIVESLQYLDGTEER